ncbi:MAG: hypothetical protein HY567_04425 [Candidatus Kerfeldbacteria bacterium]|nr:hypothetical protein [Candidatus Kerfeldbacteria bacterium]
MKSGGGWLSGQARTAAVTALVGLLVVLALVALVVSRRTSAPAPATTSSEQRLSWPLVHYPLFSVSLPLPTGMTVCQQGSAQLSVRTAACEDEATDAIVVRRQDSWDALELTAVFDDAFGQELREAGRPSLAGSGIALDGDLTSIRYRVLSATVTAAVVRDKQVRDGTSRTMAILFRRDVPLRDHGVEVQTDDVVESYLQAISFARPSERTVTTSPWKTFVSPAGWRFDYPSVSTPYQASSPAELSVTFGAGARLEVRSGRSVDEVRGSTVGYRQLNEKPIEVNGATLTEERYLPEGGSSTERMLFVSFTHGDQAVGLTLVTTGDVAEEDTFAAMLKSFQFGS